jgi:hypothetical protein
MGTEMRPSLSYWEAILFLGIDGEAPERIR